MTGSLAYRKHEAAIQSGQVPEKYLRLLPFITGSSILEIGSAEGVLSLLLADRDPSARVVGLEMRPDRHHAAVALKERWHALGRKVDGCTLVCGDIRQHLDLFEGVETLVAIRSLYYLRESIDEVLAEAAKSIPNIVLGGNPNRAKRYAEANGRPDDALGSFNYYAGVDGMVAALWRAGYTVTSMVTEGDPIVVGHR